MFFRAALALLFFTSAGAAHAALKYSQDVTAWKEMTRRRATEQVLASLLPQWPEAVKHARSVRRHHESADSPSPANPSTDVDLLVRALNEATPAHYRRNI